MPPKKRPSEDAFSDEDDLNSLPRPTAPDPPRGLANIPRAVRDGPPPHINRHNVNIFYGRGGHRRVVAEYDGFPLPSVPLPANITPREVFRFYPNHITSEHTEALMNDGLKARDIETLRHNTIRLAVRKRIIVIKSTSQNPVLKSILVEFAEAPRGEARMSPRVSEKVVKWRQVDRQRRQSQPAKIPHKKHGHP